MALTKDASGYYLDPNTNKYYSEYTAPVVPAGVPSAPYYGFSSYTNRAPAAPSGLLNFDGQTYKPFTGNALGISQGQKSMVDSLVGSRQPYEYKVPSLADLFPNMQQGGMMQGNQMQGGNGASRFMGGLLGSMPTPVSTETSQAPASAGAGRYL
jgi:hypothetical protein